MEGSFNDWVAAGCPDDALPDPEIGMKVTTQHEAGFGEVVGSHIESGKWTVVWPSGEKKVYHRAQLDIVPPRRTSAYGT